MIRRLTLLALTLAAPALAADELTVLYTGDLFGYARTPNEQRLCEVPGEAPRLYRKCGDGEGASTTPSRAAETLKALIEAKRTSPEGTLTLGVGDNFAMNYLSRVVVVVKDGKAVRFIPKDELEYDKEENGWRDIEGLRDIVASTAPATDRDQARRLLRRLGESQAKHDAQLDQDNVADFFAAAKYNAIVPGKHDFYYGPERLRQLSVYLAGRGVRMLGANLVERAEERDPAARRAESIRAKQRPYWIVDMKAKETAAKAADAKDAAESKGSPKKGNRASPVEYEAVANQAMSWKLPTHILPWMQTVRLENAFVAGKQVFTPGTAEICTVKKVDGPLSDCKPLACTEQGIENQACRTRDAKNAGRAEFFRPDDFDLRAGDTFAVCVKRQGVDKKFCKVFHVENPLLGESGERPYYVHGAERGKAAKAVVFGVVEMGLEKRIGELNSSWYQIKGGLGAEEDEVEDDLSTRVHTVDPLSAILQQLELCRRREECGASTRLVVMAHMPPTTAHLLARGLKNSSVPVSVVLSRADDEFTVTESTITYPAGTPTQVLAAAESFAVEKGYSAATPPKLYLHTVTLQGKAEKPDVVAGSWSKECTGCLGGSWIAPGDLERTSSPQTLLDKAWQALTGSVAADDPNGAGGGDKGEARKVQQVKPAELRTITLHAIRKALETDVAVMQRRDFYDDNFQEAVGWWPAGDWHDHERLESVLERILWKGDFVVKRTITGKALKEALAESKKIETAQKDPYDYQPESGRELVHLGLSQEPVSKTWYVNGQPVEDKALYSVATTDFLAYGDTGYSQFQTAAAPPDRPAVNLPGLLRLSDQLHHELCALAGSSTGVCLGKEKVPRAPKPQDYLQLSELEPFKQAPKANFGDQVRQAWNNGTARFPTLKTPTERLAHQRSYWRLLIDKGELTISTYDNSFEKHDDIDLRFPGVSTESVAARSSRTWGPAAQFELRYVKSKTHLFSRFEADYSRERTLRDEPVTRTDRPGGGDETVTQEEFLTNLKSNSYRFESGVRRPFFGVNRKRSWIGWLTSFEVNGQFADPLNSFSFNVDGGDDKDDSTLAVEGRSPQTSRYLGKAGVRWEGRQSWAETGGFYGWVDRPELYRVSINNVDQGVVCRPTQLVADENSDEGLVFETASACLKNRVKLDQGVEASQVAVRIERERSRERGFFANANYRIDLPKKWPASQLVFEERLQWFFHGPADNAADTRYLGTLSVAPTFPILRSLSLKPTYKLTLFKNRILGNRLLGRSFDMKLEYRFDWRTGAQVRQVLKHGRP